MLDNSNNVSVILDLARKSETEGDFKKTIEYYYEILKQEPHNREVLLKLLDYHLNDYDPSKSIKILQQLIKLEPSNSTYYKIAIGILIEFGKIDQAKKLAEVGVRYSKDDSIKEIIDSVNKKSDEQKALLSDEFDSTTINLIFSLFNGREGVYARQWKNTEGQTGYAPVNEPLNEKVIKNHLNGNITIGVYQHRFDSTVCWACFDIDIAKHALNNALQNDNYFRELDILCQKVAVSIYDECAKFNIPVYIENSGYKGRHCWIFFSKPIPARIAKKFTDILKANIKVSSHEISIESFPKQNFVKPDGLGNLVKLPFGIHLATGKRSYFVDKNGHEIKELNNFLKNIIRIDESKLLEYLNFYRIEYAYNEGSSLHIPPADKVNFQNFNRNYNIDIDKEFQYLLFKCPVIKEIYSNVLRKNEISYDEMIVLTHTVGHLENGVEAVNHIFSKCFNVSHDKYLKSQLKGNPISCAKIRSKLPNITSMVDCNCQFQNIDGLYPSPILHLKTMEAPLKLPSNIEVNMLNFQNVLDNYISLKKQFYEIGLMLKDYEQKFEAIFKTSGVDQLKTPVGTFRRIVDENGKVSYKIDV